MWLYKGPFSPSDPPPRPPDDDDLEDLEYLSDPDPPDFSDEDVLKELKVCTVEIEDVHPDLMDSELLIMYFENKRRSGGGPLVHEQCEFHMDKRRVVLTFVEPDGRHLHIYM